MCVCGGGFMLHIPLFFLYCSTLFQFAGGTIRRRTGSRYIRHPALRLVFRRLICRTAPGNRYLEDIARIDSVWVPDIIKKQDLREIGTVAAEFAGYSGERITLFDRDFLHQDAIFFLELFLRSNRFRSIEVMLTPAGCDTCKQGYHYNNSKNAVCHVSTCFPVGLHMTADSLPGCLCR